MHLTASAMNRVTFSVMNVKLKIKIFLAVYEKAVNIS